MKNEKAIGFRPTGFIYDRAILTEGMIAEETGYRGGLILATGIERHR